MTSPHPGENPAQGPQWAPPTSVPSFAPGATAWAPPAAPVRSRRARVLRAALVAVPALALVGGASSAATLLLTHDNDTHGTGTRAVAAGSASGTHQTAAKASLGGTITAQSGSTWTLRTSKGETVKVDLGDHTHFGTKSAPTTVTQFHDGSHVHVVGKHDGKQVQATRVTAQQTSGGSTSSSGAGGTAG